MTTASGNYSYRETDSSLKLISRASCDMPFNPPRILTASRQPRPPPLPQQNNAPRSINVRARRGNGRPIGRDANRRRQGLQALMDLSRRSRETGGATAMPSTQLKRGPLKKGGCLFRPGPTLPAGPRPTSLGGVAYLMYSAVSGGACAVARFARCGATEMQNGQMLKLLEIAIGKTRL